MSSPQPQRRVTRGFTLGLIAMMTLLALALLVASWGLLTLALQTKPVTSSVSFFAAPLIITVALALLWYVLWRTALRILRGTARAPWFHSLVAALSAYLTWVTLGSLFGMTPAETFSSAFAAALAASWFVAVWIFWLLLARQVFTTRPTPRWPWERADDD